MPENVQAKDRDDSFRLASDEAVGQGLKRIALTRAEKALRRLRGLKPGDEWFATAVHGARKDLKKLRTVLRLLRQQLGEERFEAQNRRFRDAGRALSATRDAEVKLETLEALRESAGELPGAALAWRQLLERDRDQAAKVFDSSALTEAVELIEAGREEIAAWRIEGDSWDLLDPGLAGTYRRGRRAMRRAEADPSGENLHRWRKRAKDLWYELRILGDAWPAVLEPTAEEAHRLAELLGDHHDFIVLREDLVERQLGEEPVNALLAAIANRQEELAGEAFDLGRRLYAERPKQFRRRLRGYWSAWRG
jgi:CHAD domain-containing protein